ncbi:MAG: hypothetical protein C0418_04075 [Coriobacteriaceae bacterium]|nr:hypothetical protein [Coriobacteriaceae bacterium]
MTGGTAGCGGRVGLFLNLYLGHLLGDYAFQPGRLVVAKRAGLMGLSAHIGLIGLSTALVLWRELLAYWWIVVLVMGAHFVIEKLTIAARLGTDSRGLYIFVLDQVLHILSVALLVWLTGQWNVEPKAVTFGLELETTQLAAICGALTAMLLGSIFAFEAGEAYASDDPDSLAILRLDSPRLYGMAERGLAFAAAILLTPTGAGGWASLAAMLVPFLPRIAYASTRPTKVRARQLAEAGAGLTLTAATYAAWLAIRLLVTVS